jgi:hypothetical protein
MAPYHCLLTRLPSSALHNSALSTRRGGGRSPTAAAAWTRTLSCLGADGADRQRAAAVQTTGNTTTTTPTPNRRALLFGATTAASTLLLSAQRPALAIQGLTAGRIPGLATTPDADGFLLYRRPTGKSGGHGVGWSEIPVYSFKVPVGWEETPVSIADLGGTEIDCRFAPADGTVGLSVVVAPVLRFLDLGYNADIRLPDVGPPEKLMAGFYPELFGKTMEEGDILDTQVVTRKPRNATAETKPLTYYIYELNKKRRVAITATGNRTFILALNPRTSVGARKHSEDFKRIAESFEVDAARP